jgi:hypothetical protein
MKVNPVGAEVLHADGWTYRQAGMTKLIVTFQNFANSPKNQPDNAAQGNNRCLL